MRDKTTIYDIAREAGVSVSTVSRILTGSAPVSPATKERVEAVLQKHDFRPSNAARNLSLQRSMMIGVVLPDITSPFYSTLFAEIQRYALANGYSVLMFNAMNNLDVESEGLEYLARHQVDGLIFLGGRVNEIAPDERYRAELAAFAQKVPTVIANGAMDGVKASTVCTDEQSGMTQVVDYLAQLGHQRIAMLGGVPRMTVTRDRQAAFREEMLRLGLPVVEDWLLADGFSIDSGFALMEALLRLREQPTAIIAINDLVALGILKAARHHQVEVPGRVSLVGIDDVYLSEVTAPELTSVSQNYGVLGQTIVETLLERIAGKSVPASVWIPMHLVIRDSCRPPARP